MNLVFLGTPEFAVPTLERIVDAGHRVMAVYTQPDRPKGRGQQTAQSAVKLAALRLGLPVHQPERVRRPEVVEELRNFAPDAMVIVGYGQIIPQSIIDIPPHGIINVHGSLLPAYRGAAPIQWAIARGEQRTGVTTMRINAGLDTGDILLKWETGIGSEETSPELGSRLAVAGADLLVETLRGIESGELVAIPQDSTKATFAPILKKEDGWIDWSLPAHDILNRMRGLVPWPGTYTYFRGSVFHIWKARIATAAVAAGTLTLRDKKPVVGCGEGSAIELVEVQLEGRKRMPAVAFVNGAQIRGEESLGKAQS